MSTAKPALTAFFTATHFVGGIGNLLLLIIVGFNRNVTRHPTWYGFCCSWVLYSAAFLLLTLTGHQSEPQPQPGACLTQATLVYAGTTLAAVAMFSFVLQLWIHLRSMLRDPVSRENKSSTMALLVLPYVAAFFVLLVALAEGAEHPDAVHRNTTQLYCIVDTRLPDLVVSVICVVLLSVIAILEVSMVVVFYRHWIQLWGLKSRFTRDFLSVMIRIATFSLFCVMGVIVCLIVLVKNNTYITSIFLSLLPVVSFLLLGTQVDIIRICMFWKRFPDAKLTIDDKTDGTQNI